MPKKTKAPIVPWRIHFFQRHKNDNPNETCPGGEFLDTCPNKVDATFNAVLNAVAAAPPPAFSGGGKWEVMHASMAGWYKVSVDGPQRRHYRLFCLLERDGLKVGLGGPSLVVITGMVKEFMTVFSDAEYAAVRMLGDEYRKRNPRRVR